MSGFRENILETPIEYLKGVGPVRGETLTKELNIKTFGDLLFHFPFRYVDKTTFNYIKDISYDGQSVQLKGTIINKDKIGGGRGRKRLSCTFRDSSGFIELLWFQGVKWIADSIQIGEEYIVYGKVKIYKGKRSIPHPELELVKNLDPAMLKKMDPVYNSTEKLDSKGLGVKGRRKIVKNLLGKINQKDIPEILPEEIAKKLKLASRYDAVRWIHFPPDMKTSKLALNRFKFEELFLNQLLLAKNRADRKKKLVGAVFSKVGNYFHKFYEENLPFELTKAQKRVIKEIRYDLGEGVQMNRLLQGDVGSGKTIVALMTMLIAIDNGFQSCLMAPTEILAYQHYNSISNYLKGLGVRIAFLSGTVKGNKRKELLKMLKRGDIHILIGTHALIEEHVIFQNLGMAIIDEQHRFGVGQRAKLWAKNENVVPHILVMTATPIPRTLAMTRYGDLDVSVIDELPPGRKEIKTIHRTEYSRPKVITFMKNQIDNGGQIYVVYPLIDESEKLDLQNLQTGYERLLHQFPRPQYQISVVHGRMKAEDKEFEMNRFLKNETQIMVATTVIEVGVNVPNASVMIIENAERFGLSQLHQLRGRVGRGAAQSYCILMTGNKMSKYAKERIQTMVRTNDGFQIAEADLILRGPGDISGTQQSGIVDFQVASLVEDQKILQVARHFARNLVEDDPKLESIRNKNLRNYMDKQQKLKKDWARIS